MNTDRPIANGPRIAQIKASVPVAGFREREGERVITETDTDTDADADGETEIG